MHRWTAIFLPPIRISIFEQDIAMLRYIKTSDMCKKFMKSLPVNVNPLAKPCISACVRRFKTETNEKKKATHPRLAFFSLQRVAMYFIWWENASLPPYSLQPVALYKGVQILESGKFLLAELGILALENHANDWNSESKFYRQKIRNPVPGTRNPYKDLNPESTFHWQTQTEIQYLESGIHCVESRIQDCIGFPYMGQSRFVLRWCYTRRFATNDFQRNTALQCWNNVATIWSNVATML